MSLGLCSRRQRLLRQAFIDGNPLPRHRAERLWRHLRSCRECRTVYNRAVRLERLAASGGASSSIPTKLELLLWQERIAAQAETPADTSSLAGYRVLRPLAVGVCLLVIAVTSWLVIRPSPGDLASRDAQMPGLAVRAFCEQLDLTGQPIVRSLSDDPHALELDTCPSSGTVRFASLSPRPGYLYAAALMPDGRIIWLSPGAREQTPEFVAASAELTPLTVSLPPGFAGSAEAVDVVFVLASGPGEQKRVDAELRASPSPGRLLSASSTPSCVRRIHFGSHP